MPNSCKATFSPFICRQNHVGLNLVAGVKYWISDQVFTFTSNIIRNLDPYAAPPGGPSPQPGPVPPAPRPPGGPIIGTPGLPTGDASPPPQAPTSDILPGPGPMPFPTTFQGRLLAYSYLETINRPLAIPTVVGNQYLTYTVCDLECVADGGGDPDANVACCDSLHNCVELPYGTCVSLQGGVLPGKTCMEAQLYDFCWKIGACCLPDATCINTLETCCGSLLGLFYGVGTLCSDYILSGGICAGVGACCNTLTGECIANTAYLCNQLGSPWVFQGPQTACGPEGTCGLIGVCCPGLNSPLCLKTTEDNCLSFGGDWLGPGSCEPNPCDAIGACCLVDHFNGGAVTCQMLGQSQCKALFGAWYGNQDCGTVICPEPGAVCDIPAVGALSCFYSFHDWYLSLPPCVQANYIWNGEGTLCTQINCNFGACCSAMGCENTLFGDCSGHPLMAFWTDSAACKPTGCGTSCVGACCEGFPPLTLCFSKEWQFCDGLFLGTGVACIGGEGAACQDIAGACCIGTFHETCVDGLLQTDCEAMGGIWHPEADQFCATIPPPCTRGCCLPDNTCEDYSQEHCAAVGGTWDPLKTCFQIEQGGGCVGGPPGPCCLCTGPQSGSCVEIPQSECDALNGLWLGDSQLGCIVVEMGGQGFPIDCNLHVSCCPNPPCGPCGFSGQSCCDFYPNPGPGCSNALCCMCVCAIDSFCCEQWDSTCTIIAQTATGACGPVCDCPPP